MDKTLIIFDVDETLVYSDRLDSQSFADTYEFMFGKSFPTLDWHQYPHVTDTTIFRTALERQFNRQPSEEERNTFEDHYVSLLEEGRRKNPRLFKSIIGARQIIDLLLRDENYVVAIGTGGWLKPAMIKLQHVGIPAEKLFWGAADGHETRYAIINHLISEVQTIHSDIHRIVYVGDALWDVKTTRQMGINFIGIRRKGDMEVLKSEGVKEVISDYSDINMFIKSVQSAQPPDTIA